MTGLAIAGIGLDVVVEYEFEQNMDSNSKPSDIKFTKVLDLFEIKMKMLSIQLIFNTGITPLPDENLIPHADMVTTVMLIRQSLL